MLDFHFLLLHGSLTRQHFQANFGTNELHMIQGSAHWVSICPSLPFYKAQFSLDLQYQSLLLKQKCQWSWHFFSSQLWLLYGNSHMEAIVDWRKSASSTGTFASIIMTGTVVDYFPAAILFSKTHSQNGLWAWPQLILYSK